mmetsp:Transcript_11739/g.32144  ORF Transcript_11739/g.32144 Transcript_11739/m.32144 type:complete len:203 (-) Transcript_11739:595-1203(-)
MLWPATPTRVASTMISTSRTMSYQRWSTRLWMWRRRHRHMSGSAVKASLSVSRVARITWSRRAQTMSMSASFAAIFFLFTALPSSAGAFLTLRLTCNPVRVWFPSRSRVTGICAYLDQVAQSFLRMPNPVVVETPKVRWKSAISTLTRNLGLKPGPASESCMSPSKATGSKCIAGSSALPRKSSDLPQSRSQTAKSSDSPAM